MKLTDIYNKLDETLDSALPFKKISPTRYQINLTDTDILYVILYPKNIDNCLMLAISFINPNSTQPFQLTNFFNGPRAIRVFSTIVKIIDEINFDIIVATPDDISVDVEQQKLRLYQIILKKIQRENKIFAYEVIEVPEFDKPIIVGLRRKLELTTNQLIDLIKKFGLSKINV